jgi:hypothetical protein
MALTKAGMASGKSNGGKMAIDRDSQNSVHEVVQSLIPEEIIRHKCLDFLADSINTAYGLAPDRWGLTLKKDMIRLNVGKIEVLALFPKMVHCLIDLDSTPKELLGDDMVIILKNESDPTLGYYRSVPGSIVCNVFVEDFEEVLPLIQDSHRILIENASQTGRNPMTKKAHAPAVIDFLSSYLGRDIPHPDYLKG